ALVVNTSATYAQDNGSVIFTSNRPVNWSLAPGSSGTLTVVNSTHAVYTAPPSIQNQNVLAGCPVDPNSVNWTSAANVGSNGLGFDTAWGTSVVDNTVPMTNEVFYYTGGYNGYWLLPFLPELKREVGTYVSDQN